MTTIEQAPPRLGRDFGVLWGAAISSNLADGLARTAVPLIATTITRDPLAISAIGAVAFLPWLVFGLPAGMVVDRFDRRRVMAAANGLRGLVALGLAFLAAGGLLTIEVLIAATLVFGIGETLFDNATNALVPAVVPAVLLDRANGRLTAAQITVDNFVATPVAGVLFAVSLSLPLWLGAAGFIVPVALALLLPLSAAHPMPDPDVAPARRRGAGASAGEAVRYLWRFRHLRSITIFTTIIGCSFSFAQAAVILYFLDELDVPPAAIGFVTAGVGVGALVGSLLAPAMVARFGRGPVMLGANVAAIAGLLAVWAAPNLVLGVLAYAGAAAAVATWNVPWAAFRQMVIPNRLFGRVLGIMRSLTWGLMSFATLLGGLVARIDLRLPFLVGAAICVVATACWARAVVRSSQFAGPVEIDTQ